MDHLNENCRKELLRLLSWQVGAENGYGFSVGKKYKYLPKYLGEEQYKNILLTMNVSSRSLVWSALISLQKQFNTAAKAFSRKNNLYYDHVAAEKVMNYTIKCKAYYK